MSETPNMDKFTEDEVKKLQILRDKYILRRDIIMGRSDLRYPLDNDFRIGGLKYRDPESIWTRKYTDGQVFEIVDRYAKCPESNSGQHVQSQIRTNFCILCNKALSEI